MVVYTACHPSVSGIYDGHLCCSYIETIVFERRANNSCCFTYLHFVTTDWKLTPAQYSLEPTTHQLSKRPHTLKDSMMSNEPTKAPSRQTNTPQVSNDQALMNMELPQVELLRDVDPDEIEQILAEYDPTFNQVAMDDFLANFNVPTPPPESTSISSRPPPQLVNAQEAIQGYLIQMQACAGVSRDNIQAMHSSDAARRIRGPVLFRFTNNDLRIPLIPPATFTGHLAPLPSYDALSWNSQTLEYFSGFTHINDPSDDVSFHLAC